MLCFVLECLERTIESSARGNHRDGNLHSRTAIAVACILSLVSGKGPPHDFAVDEYDQPVHRHNTPMVSQNTKIDHQVYFSAFDIVTSAMRSDGESDANLYLRRDDDDRGESQVGRADRRAVDLIDHDAGTFNGDKFRR